MALTPEQIAALPYDPRNRPDPELALPDLSEAVIGWRSWRVKLEGPKYGLPIKLHSASFDHYWAPHRANKAICDKGHPCTDDELPGETCTCGFYSAKSARHLLKMGYHRYFVESGWVCVIGKVACWGKVLEGSQGWRSTYCYPTQIYVPFEAAHLAKPIAEAYGVKTSLMNFLTRQV